MDKELYRKLARRLDAIPNGFPASESGVELRLLAKIFTAEEAILASVMRLTPEPSDVIAGWAGIEMHEAKRMLKGMVRKGLIRIQRGEGHLLFGLRPFIVGIYEEQLRRMDEDFARLFEEYYREVFKDVFLYGPSVHRVIPVDKAIPFELEIFPYERAIELLEGAKSWGVRDCICRVQQRFVGRACDHEIENCLLFAPVENAFNNSELTRPIAKEDSLRILGEAAQAGLVHCTANHRSPLNYICNCCTCCCGVMRGLAEFGMPAAVARSDFYASVDSELCAACGSCIERCPFGALSVSEDVCVVDRARCMGCGLCVSACSTGAACLQRRSEGEVPATPKDIPTWMTLRAENRGILMSAIE
ncbi:MAG: 4Fe-4S binding protein [bacterium]